jgi:hypothetical protein
MSTERKQRPVKPIPDALDPAETVALEQPWLMRAGVLAVLAGILLVVGFALSAVATSGIKDDITHTRSVAESLQYFATPGHGANGLVGANSTTLTHLGDNWLTLLAGKAASGLAVVLAIPILFLLIRGAWRRRPSFPRWFISTPAIGGVLFGIGSIALYYGSAHDFHTFAQLGTDLRTNGRAFDIYDSVRHPPLALQIGTSVGQLLTAVAVGAAALSAMNVGLLTKVLGTIGVMLAVVAVVPILGQSGDVLRAFWFIAVGMTLLGRWSGGRPVAWESGEAVPWPTRAQLMEEADRAQSGGRTKAGRGSDPAPAPTPKKQPGGNRKKRRK